MTETVEIQIDHRFVKQYYEGYQHIPESLSPALRELKTEGVYVDLMTPEGVFIARGYHGHQNKGYGWVFTQDASMYLTTDFLRQLFSDAIGKRQKLFHDDETTAFRLFNGEGDHLGGVTVDLYNDCALVQWYSLGIYEHREKILDALEAVYPVKAIYQKKRFREGGKYMDADDFVRGERIEFPILVKENGVLFNVDLNDGPMTGIFLDQREVRQRIREQYSKGKTMLNAFSYTGAFSVYAALGGADQTTSVDLAKRSLPMTIAQFSANGIDFEAQEIRVMDVFNYFDYALKHALTYDLVVLDPPSFARSKKRVFSVQKDYVKLLEQALRLTNDGGVIVASTNYSGFDMKKFKQFIKRAFHNQHATYKILETYTQPEDFPYDVTFKESQYLKVVFIKKLS
jgi:23S rRNA (cytosine1962-C5)-methyltransferase